MKNYTWILIRIGLKMMENYKLLSFVKYCKYVTILVKIQKKLVGLMGTYFFTLLTKIVKFFFFFVFFVLFSSFVIFFVVSVQICAEVERSETGSNIFVTRTQKRWQKMGKEQKRRKRRKIWLFSSKAEKSCPQQYNTFWRSMQEYYILSLLCLGKTAATVKDLDQHT